MMGMGGHGGRQNSEQDAKHIAAIFSVTGAFFDSVGKPSSAAQSWLEDKANQWLKKSATLKLK